MATLRAAVIIYSDVELCAQLFGLSLVGYVDMIDHAQRGKPYPPLYMSGVKYVREPPGSEVWQIPRGSYSSKDADCEDLCAGWRVPELWMLGETKAAPFVKRISARLRHILVERADGTLEDPSVILGMHKRSDPGEAREALRAVRPPIPTPDVPIPFGLPRWSP